MSQPINDEKKENEKEEKLLLPLPKFKIWWIMIVIYLLYVMDFAVRYVISPMFPLLKKELLLSDAQLGLLGTIVLAMVAILSLPLSYVIDKWRRGKSIAILAIVWSVGSFFSGLSTNFSQLLISRGILGVGEASYVSGGIALIGATIKKVRRALVLSLWGTAVAVGTALGMSLGGVLSVTWGWRATFMIVAVPGIIFGILAWFLPDYVNKHKKAEKQGGAASGFAATMKEFFKNKTLVTLCITFGLVYLYCNSLIYWMPTYFVRYLNMDIATAGTISGMVFLAAVLFSPVGGWITDKIAKKSMRSKAIQSFIGAMLSFICFVLALIFNVVPVFFLPMAFILFYDPAQKLITQEVVPFYQHATSYGLYLSSMFIFGGLWGPVLTGAISDASDLKTAFWVTAAIVFVAAFGYLLVYKFYNQDRQVALEKEAKSGLGYS